MLERTEYDYHPQAVAAFQNENVLAALRDTAWFTPELIIDIRDHEPAPKRDGCGPFEDKFLGDFLRFGFDRGDLGPDNAVFAGIKLFLAQRTVGPQGHPLPFNLVPFADAEFMALAERLGADESYEVDRGMIWSIPPLVKCLIAPLAIRRQVIRQICSWGEGYENVKRDTLLWAELVRKGVQAYLERPAPQPAHLGTEK